MCVLERFVVSLHTKQIEGKTESYRNTETPFSQDQRFPVHVACFVGLLRALFITETLEDYDSRKSSPFIIFEVGTGWSQ